MFTEVVRAMTFVIDQGMAMYWGTSRWNAVEIMVGQNVEPHQILEPQQNLIKTSGRTSCRILYRSSGRTS